MPVQMYSVYSRGRAARFQPHFDIHYLELLGISVGN